MNPVLIYCSGKNMHLAEIAIAEGFKYGAQVPCTVYYPLYFADQNWKRPNRKAYMDALEKYKPEMATVLDWEIEEQLEEVLSWAEEASQYVNKILIVPKVMGGISKIPNIINGKDVILAYSIPTRFGGTSLPFWEFSGRNIHFLGGSPYKQIIYYQYMRQIADVISIDGNYHQMKAIRFCEHWEYPNHWISDGHKTSSDAHYNAFKKSCENIMKYWTGHNENLLHAHR